MLCHSPRLMLCHSPHLMLCHSPHLMLCHSPRLMLCHSPHLMLCHSPHFQISQHLHLQGEAVMIPKPLGSEDEGALNLPNMGGTACPVTQHTAAESLNHQQHYCVNLKFCRTWILMTTETSKTLLYSVTPWYVYFIGQWWILSVDSQQLLQRWNQVAWCRLSPPEALRLWGQWRTAQLRALP